MKTWTYELCAVGDSLDGFGFRKDSIRRKVLHRLQKGPLTAEEVAKVVGEREARVALRYLVKYGFVTVQ